MKSYLLRIATLLLVVMSINHRAYAESYDYFQPNRELIRNGVQAVLQCNGLFTSDRSLEQVFDQELAYLTQERFGGKVGTAQEGAYQVDSVLRRVTVGGGEYGTPVSAVFREGVGCVVMAPDQTQADIGGLPELTLPYSDIDPDTVDWPDGDRITEKVIAAEFDLERLQAASDWAFNRETPEQDTLSLIVLHKGQIVHERYAAGITRETRTRTWSTAKSIAVTLIGMLIDEGRMKLDEPLGFVWKPELLQPEQDPRNAITLRNVLQMSSGLYPVDSFNMEYATGSGLSYWAGASSVSGMLDRGLVRQPGTYWDYENYDTLMAVYAMKRALGSEEVYAQYPRKALFDRIGMRNTVVSTDRFGDFIFSSAIYSNARDLARFGLLYARDGVWNGERLLSSRWIDFVRAPAPATGERGHFYGAQWWLVPDDRDDIPRDAYATAGNRGQYVIVVPSYDLVIVRRGLDYGKQGFDRWDLTREVITAFAAP
ncbi:MAG: serine hydrolase [Halioglobus sp.]